MEELLYNTSKYVDNQDAINEKFSEIPLESQYNCIIEELNITDKNEINKIKQACFTNFGTKIGILSFEDACTNLNLDPNHNLIILNHLSNDIRTKFIAEYKLKIIIEALNEGWTPDWEDQNQIKYYNYFITKGGFSSDSVSYFNAFTNVPSALCLKSEELARYCGNMFLDLYKDMLI